jgi:prepilin-type N-terminal cleavage/methylation domain-containing protein
MYTAIGRGLGDERGFSLIEALAVSAVIAVLIAIAVPIRSDGSSVVLDEGGTFTGFNANCTAVRDDCDVADGVETSVAWVGPGAPVNHEMSIVCAAENSVLMVARSAAGSNFCVAQSTGEPTAAPDRRSSTWTPFRNAGGWSAGQRSSLSRGTTVLPRLPTRDHDREAGMRRASLRARLRARVDRNERGFTIVETVIAITVIFGALTAMAYTATAGFTTIAYGRERIQATGLANKIMEEIRGLAYVKITQGIKTTELTTDPRIVFCTSDSSYHFESCTSSDGSGEKMVSTSGLANTAWLVPHTGNTTVGDLRASWAVYVTNNNTASNPYRVTVIVDWTSRARPTAPNNTVRIQSLFWSPSGCVSEETHPFAAPCQPFFYGQASVPQGQIKIAGQFHNGANTTWSQSVVKLTGVEADLQQEQVSELQSTFTQSGVTMTDGSGTSTAGGTTTNAVAADSDPASTSSLYASNGATGASDTLAAHQSDSYTATSNEIGLTVFTPAGDSGTAQAAIQGSATNVCPPPTDTGETDSLPCAGSRVQMGSTGGAATATSLFSHALGSTGLGSATIVSAAAAPSNPNKAFVDREAVASQDGRVEMTATRKVGTINIGGLPSGMTAPTGWTGASVWNGYCVSLVGYQDATTAQAGTSTSAPSATIDAGARIYYYNGTGFSNKTTIDPTLSAQTVSCTRTQTINSKVVVWTVAVTANGLTPAATATSSSSGGVATTRTDVEASVTPPSIVAQYTVSIAGVTEMDYTITLDLGVNRARGVYGPAPVSG